ncbi:MAG: PilZ domain-containing protein [Saccharospirillaceae bacterium]|nr:PilZ domain-containing protein [Pseudomonadales bacterium]NRB78287.1 PilZ domain-containing protein [Saccharospirillaceae bacterium]
MNPTNHRQFQRVNLNAPISILMNDKPTITARSFDFSEGGVYIILEEAQSLLLNIGSIVRVQFQGLNFTPPIMTAEVVRKDKLGCGLLLIDTYKLGEAPDEIIQ